VVALRGIGMMALPGAARRLREAERTRFLTQEWPQVAARMYRLGLTLADLPGMDALK
jgi:GntR family transcriptional regulator